jgi:predicted enzyme related to lactoylglutathione lyase
MPRFTWFEYLTSEPAKAQAFFKAAFGWDAQTFVLPGGARHTVIICGGRAIGSYGEPLRGTPTFRYSEPYSRWIPLLQTTDGHGMVGLANARGGTVAREMSPLHDGRRAIIADPSGQHAGIWHPANDEPRDWGTDPGSFCWVELYSEQPGATAVFFKHLAGFTEQKSQLPDGPYHMLEHEGVPHAGVRKPLPGTQLGWFPWVRVPDMAKTLATALTFEVAVIESPVPGGMPKALIVDPYGATIGLAQG